MDATAQAAQKEQLRQHFAKIDQRKQQIRARFPEMHDATMTGIAVHDAYWNNDEWLAQAERLNQSSIG